MEIRGVDRKHVAINLPGLFQILELLLVELPHPEARLNDLIGIRESLDLARQDRDELGIHAALCVDALEGLEGRQIQRIYLERALVVGHPLVGLGHLAFQKLTEIEQDDPTVFVLNGDVERARERLTHLLPLRSDAVDVRHLPHDLHVVRIELHHLRVVRLRVLGAAEVFAVPLAETKAELDLLTRILLFLEPGVGRVDELTPSTRDLRDPLQVRGGRVVRVVFTERIHEGVEGLVVVFELLLEHRRDVPQ